MTRLKTIAVLILIGTIIIFSLGVYSGYRFFGPKKEAAPEVDSQLILTALHDRGFLVTQTYVFDQPVTITKSSGSTFKDFFFGQKITARGTMEVNLGIDLAGVSREDVIIDADAVTIRIPKASLFNARLVGPIELKNDQGILKRLLDSDDGYNEALAELSKVAESSAVRDDLVERATDRAKEDVARLVGYLTEGKDVKVEIR